MRQTEMHGEIQIGLSNSIVSQICSASASNCALRKRIARGCAVVPKVELEQGDIPAAG